MLIHRYFVDFFDTPASGILSGKIGMALAALQNISVSSQSLADAAEWLM